MAAFLIYTLAAIGLLTLTAIAVVAVAVLTDDPEEELERWRIECEVRSAERRLHDIARGSFEQMLEEARTSGPGR
jgi:hypothetical protein